MAARRLWIRPLDSLDARSIPGTDDADLPFWSPDEEHLAFFAQGKLKKVAVTGVPPKPSAMRQRRAAARGTGTA